MPARLRSPLRVNRLKAFRGLSAAAISRWRSRPEPSAAAPTLRSDVYDGSNFGAAARKVNKIHGVIVRHGGSTFVIVR